MVGPVDGAVASGLWALLIWTLPELDGSLFGTEIGDVTLVTDDSLCPLDVFDYNK